jgi:type II secretory pathway pseudopilin PulG
MKQIATTFMALASLVLPLLLSCSQSQKQQTQRQEQTQQGQNQTQQNQTQQNQQGQNQPTGTQAVEKRSLRVLYVGGTADWGIKHFNGDSALYRRNIADRAASFEAMLKRYFTDVTVIDASKWTEATSKEYDVTVMDGVPPRTVPAVRETDDKGAITKYLQAGCISEAFSLPMVTIGEASDAVGRRIGLKLDWYCLCLEADAHHFRAEHPIFHKPFPVTMTVRTRPTPPDAFHYAYFSDAPVPDSIPMWQVQTMSYERDNDFRIGMVSRPWGFEDSPEAEYISSGVCAKSLDAVAIGRHGNYLHWGFAASPAYMTDEAQTVLANAIVYISGFSGQGVIARKYNDRIATREYLRELKHLCTRESWQERLKMEDDYNRESARRRDSLKKLPKERLSKSELQLLDFTPSPPMSFEAYVKRYQKDFFDRFGTDTKAYHKFYDENRDYFYSHGFYHIELDEDVKSLGIPNNDKRLLDAAIKLLESGTDAAKGRRILTRYTLMDFATAKEWRAWYGANRNRLFFTEAGGWVFLVNSREAGVNDYKAKEVRTATAELSAGETNDQTPVSFTAQTVHLQNGNKEIVAKLAIHPGYHIYATVAKKDPFIPTKLDFKLPDGYRKVGEMLLPAQKPFGSSGTTVYEDVVIFRQEIAAVAAATATASSAAASATSAVTPTSATAAAAAANTAAHAIQCTLYYQCCDDHICFPPEELNISIPVR